MTRKPQLTFVRSLKSRLYKPTTDELTMLAEVVKTLEMLVQLEEVTETMKKERKPF